MGANGRKGSKVETIVTTGYDTTDLSREQVESLEAESGEYFEKVRDRRLRAIRERVKAETEAELELQRRIKEIMDA